MPNPETNPAVAISYHNKTMCLETMDIVNDLIVKPGFNTMAQFNGIALELLRHFDVKEFDSLSEQDKALWQLGSTNKDIVRYLTKQLDPTEDCEVVDTCGGRFKAGDEVTFHLKEPIDNILGTVELEIHKDYTGIVTKVYPTHSLIITGIIETGERYQIHCKGHEIFVGNITVKRKLVN